CLFCYSKRSRTSSVEVSSNTKNSRPSFRAHIATFLVDGMGFFAGTEKRQISPANYLWYQLATNQIVA
ncbi:hypothetical protein, partial [Lapidilactobacillus luobeiensis]|uniref:hypothetical protein n=1 Tax=Lapidilactobacillus luobeiensis TaxID=2950371 RepID=UPI0021C3766D